MHRRWSFLLLGILLVTTPTRAVAESAEELLQRAMELFADGALSQSAQVLERALAVTREPQLLGKIHLQRGLIHAAEGERERAREAFRQALLHEAQLKLDPFRNRPDFVQLLQEVRQALEGELVVTTDLPRSELWLDGRHRGPLPYQCRLMRGDHRLELRDHTGRVRLQRKVTITEGRVTQLELQLAPPQPPPVRTRLEERDPPAEEPVQRRRRIWTWVAAGGALATGAAALGLTISAAADHRAACDLLADPTQPCDQRTQLVGPDSTDRYADLHATVGRKALAANICWGLAGGLTLASAVLFWLEPRLPHAAESSRRSTLRIFPGGAMVHLAY